MENPVYLQGDNFEHATIVETSLLSILQQSF